jgi:multicomponent Na+:H+ antiporter subunit D
MSAPHIVAAPILVALATAVLTLLTRPMDRLQRSVSVLGSVAYLGVVALLASEVLYGQPLVYQVSDWQAPFGIVLVGDSLAAFMLVLAAVVSLFAIVFSVSYVDGFGQRLAFHPLYHFMLVGVSGAFLTGDIFNLFVWFEVMLMSSYVLVLFYSGAEHTRAALSYVVLNLLGSAVMLLAIGGLYATTGTLNMADLARRLANPAAFDVALAPTLGLGALLFTVFALKAGLVPFHFWVPGAYKAAPSPVTAVLAGVVKKVGVYAIVRLYFTVFAAASVSGGFGLPGISPAGEGAFLGYFGPVLFVMATASILVGGLGAVGRDSIDGMLAFSSIGQVGFIMLPLAVAATVPEVRVLGVTAALLYAFNHGLAKALLFFVSGTLKEAVGTERFVDLGGVARNAPYLAAGFFVGALALIGIPPLPGFFAKFFVFRTGAEAWAQGGAGAPLALAVALVGAILTIAYFTRGWNSVFWGVGTDHVRAVFRDPSTVRDGATATDGGLTEGRAIPPLQLGVVVGLALVTVAAGVGFEQVLSAADAAAKAAVDTQGYVDVVAPADSAGTSGGESGESGGGHSLRTVGALLVLAGPNLVGRLRRRWDE